MSVERGSTKEQKQMAVSVAVLEVIEKDGLLGVSHSKVARKAGVSRAWIYEYIGKEKAVLIEHAAEVFAQHFARLEPVDLPKDKSELADRLREGIQFLFDSVELSPVVIKLYFRFRGTTNPLGLVIQKYEKHWLETAARTLQEILLMPEEQALILVEAALVLRLGFAHRYATSAKPRLTRERAEQTFDFIHRFIHPQD